MLLEYHNRISRIYCKFKKLWENEYLASLREKHDFTMTQPNHDPKFGEIVLVNILRENKLPLAKIVDVMPGKDGQVREVMILREGKIYRVTINKLIPLEISQSTIDDCDLPEVQASSVHPKQAAAIRSDSNRLKIIADDQL